AVGRFGAPHLAGIARPRRPRAPGGAGGAALRGARRVRADQRHRSGARGARGAGPDGVPRGRRALPAEHGGSGRRQAGTWGLRPGTCPHRAGALRERASRRDRLPRRLGSSCARRGPLRLACRPPPPGPGPLPTFRPGPVRGRCRPPLESTAMSTVLSAVAWPYANGPRPPGPGPLRPSRPAPVRGRCRPPRDPTAMSTVLSAVAGPYATGPRHIGHVAGFGVPSDVFSRYMRMAGHDVLMVSGTDEHG